MTCRECKKDIPRFWTGKWANKGKVYVCDNGRKWYGHRCPDCYLAISCARQKLKRMKKRGYTPELFGPKEPEYTEPPRRCRKCKCTLPQSKYFTCEMCTPKVELQDWGYEFYG